MSRARVATGSVVMAARLFQPACTLSGKGHEHLAEVLVLAGQLPRGQRFARELGCLSARVPLQKETLQSHCRVSESLSGS